MASPVDSARQGTNITTAATSHAINVGSPVAGTLLIVFVRFAGAPGTVTFTGYTQFAADTSDASDDDSRLYYRWADGAEGATDTLSTTNSVKLAALCWEITGAENPATTAPSVSPAIIGTAANINPPLGGGGFVTTADGLFSQDVRGDGATAFERMAQSFTATATSISFVGATISKALSPTDDFVLEIQGDSSGSPDGTALTTVATIAGASVSTTATYTEWSVSLSGLSIGNTYWLVARRTGAIDATNYFRLHGTNSNVYAGGLAKQRNNGSWITSGLTVLDCVLRVVSGDAKDYLFLTVVGLDSETATFTSPSGYSTATTANSGTGGAVATNCMIAGASKQATAASDDPGAWTSTAPASGVVAWTIAIAPAAPAAPGPPPALLRSPLRRRAARFLTFR